MSVDATRSAVTGSPIVTYSCGRAARFCVFWSVLSPRGCGLTSFGAEAYNNCIRFWRGSLARLSLSHSTSGATQLSPPRPIPPAWPRSSRSRRPQPELAHSHQGATRGCASAGRRSRGRGRQPRGSRVVPGTPREGSGASPPAWTAALLGVCRPGEPPWIQVWPCPVGWIENHAGPGSRGTGSGMSGGRICAQPPRAPEGVRLRGGSCTLRKALLSGGS